MSEFIVRFLIGGIVVSLFAILGDVLRPKSFAGLFGAAPSIALATIGLTIDKNGTQYAATEARSMILGAAAFFLYAVCVSWILGRYKPSTLTTTVGLIPVWFGMSFAFLYLLHAVVLI
jgi:hydrogenase-4 membrane subunit HyfE